MCDNDISDEAAALARKAFPDSLPWSERRIQRNEFIRSRSLQLFDVNHDGHLDFDEYLNAEWAGYLAQLPAGKCIVTREDFIRRFLGDATESTNGLNAPYQKQIYNNMFDALDSGGKGYLTKDDIRAQARRSFDFEKSR